MPLLIIDEQLESLRKASQVKPHDSTGLIIFSMIVSNFLNKLKEYKQIGDILICNQARHCVWQ